MACNVFGTPVTNETLKGLPEFQGKKLQRKDRARVALELKNAEGKDVNAHRYAVEVKTDFEDTPVVLVMIYNATGDPISFVDEHDTQGHLCRSPYPIIIANGQWGVFGHGKYWDKDNWNQGGVVYSGKNSEGKVLHWILSWSNYRKIEKGENRVYTKVCSNTGKYEDTTWTNLVNELNFNYTNEDEYKEKKRLVHQDYSSGGIMFASMGNDAVSFVEAILTLRDSLPDDH